MFKANKFTYTFVLWLSFKAAYQFEQYIRIESADACSWLTTFEMFINVHVNCVSCMRNWVSNEWQCEYVFIMYMHVNWILMTSKADLMSFIPLITKIYLTDSSFRGLQCLRLDSAEMSNIFYIKFSTVLFEYISISLESF